MWAQLLLNTLILVLRPLLFLDSQETSFYGLLNTQLSCDRDPGKLDPWLPYVKLLTSAIYSLPPRRVTVYRGVKPKGLIKGKLLIDCFAKGAEKRWLTIIQLSIWAFISYAKYGLRWAFTSTSSSVGTLKHFLGQVGHRILFAIEAVAAFNVHEIILSMSL